MGREAKAREDRTPIQLLEESVAGQMEHLENLLKQHEEASADRERRLRAHLVRMQGLELTGHVRIFGIRFPIALCFSLPKPPKAH